MTVGWAEIGGVKRAIAWDHNWGYTYDLHQLLPPGDWGASQAMGVPESDGNLFVVGIAMDAMGLWRAMLWKAPAANACYCDCNRDSLLNIDDFVCFQTTFALGGLYADCDGDGQLAIDDSSASNRPLAFAVEPTWRRVVMRAMDVRTVFER